MQNIPQNYKGIFNSVLLFFFSSSTLYKTMNKENDQTFFYQLGSYPEISLAELKSVLNLNGLQCKLKPATGFVIINNLQTDTSLSVFHQLGGCPRLMRIVWRFDRNEKDDPQLTDKLLQKIVQLLSHDTKRKITFGISMFGWPLKTAHVLSRNFATGIKQALNRQDVSSNYAGYSSDSYPCLPPAAVSNLMKSAKTGTELCLIHLETASYMAVTVDATDYEPFEKLDMHRPDKDMTAGILPPKLARIMINLAETPRDKQIYDPFCGDGTIMMEASRLGHLTAGSDISPEAVEAATRNIEWYRNNIFNSGKIEKPPVVLDARKLSEFTGRSTLDCVVTETHLGPPIRGKFTGTQAETIIADLSPFYRDTLREIALSLKKHGKVVIALPSFQASGIVHTLRLPDLRIDRCFNVLGHHAYSRPEQKIRREIYILERKAQIGD